MSWGAGAFLIGATPSAPLAALLKALLMWCWWEEDVAAYVGKKTDRH